MKCENATTKEAKHFQRDYVFFSLQILFEPFKWRHSQGQPPLSRACCVGPVYPPASDRVIRVLWQNLESNCLTYAHPRAAGLLTGFTWLRSVINRNHASQEAHKHRAPIAPRIPDLSTRDACSYHTESNALPTELPGPASFTASVRIFVLTK